MPVVLALGKWRQEDEQLKIILRYRASSKLHSVTPSPRVKINTHSYGKKMLSSDGLVGKGT